ncbi:allophanate hydrolase subunit 1 [Vibrio sp. TH_r3]|uniref:5-oxoprolinase subunit B family protein n=1 Tax=Vibrio sp. TH_r3 TaxID=3082084 RepID=UPI002955CE1C|nr:allophanate hydrolase subunit 1 [Vibrio sp. TH_r3]MDV7103522.1 allophanate hydrolase subunit 1 [Vibrio sp. TH_r3]
MLKQSISIDAVSESSILIRFSDKIDDQLAILINQVAELIYSHHSDCVMNLTPSYTTLLIDYLPYRTGEKELIKNLTIIVAQIEQKVESDTLTKVGKVIHLPVYYAEDVAPDLLSLLQDKSITLQALIDKHTQPEYRVCSIGFSPGFSFLSGLVPELESPRHNTPRLKVAAGSVGIANNQTAVYPSATPGGWKIIGNCPSKLFDPTSDTLSPFRVGDKVKFESITREHFIELGGKLWAI